MRPLLFIFILIFFYSVNITAQDDSSISVIKSIRINGSGNLYYTFRYRDVKPDDVSLEVYDGLWEVQKEVVDNFTYDYAVLQGRKKAPAMTALEDYYRYGSGVCENYSNFFILLAREKGLTENLYKVSGNRRASGGHAWLEYHTENNVYIIDPTWSDDYFLRGQALQRFRESPAYGKRAFFITYEESRIIYRGSTPSSHSVYTTKTEIPLWDTQ